ncbi:hypothetical protein QYE76_006315 [Lolium multiflorum]|uniref:Proton pump-interactor 1 n=1 Tax=Lolium multiflorum TaxID=4521 RepID=A0AAD8RUN4_LOLMU|nr:hypothetical protein QYE76_006315 [Lolium multiflorum]
MTTACNGAGEAPKAELAAAKAAAGERPAEEREGVGGPFVIVNGDSDGLSDRCSDKADSRSDEDDLPPPNAAPDAGAGGDHGADDGGESGAPDATTVGLPSSNGHGGPAAVESEDDVGEGKAEGGDNSEDGLLREQGEELGGEEAPAELGTDHADDGADSASPAVDSVVTGKEVEEETSAPSDVAAPEEQQNGADASLESSSPDDTRTQAESDPIVLGKELEKESSAPSDVAAPEEQQDGASASLESSSPDDTPTQAESDPIVLGKEVEKDTSAPSDVAAPEEQQDGASASLESSSPDDTPTEAESDPIVSESDPIVLESEGSGEQSKEEEIDAEIKELGTDGSGVSEVNGQHDAGVSADSCVTATEPVIHLNEGKHQQSAVTELVEQDGSNGHAHAEPIADSCTSAPESDIDGGLEQQSDALEAEPEVSDGSNCGAYKGPVEEEVAANGLGCAEDTLNTSAELETAVDEGEGEVASGVVETEAVIGKDSEGDLHDGQVVAVTSDEEAKPPAEEGISEAIPAESGVCVITGNVREPVVQDDELVKNDVSSGILHSEQSEPDQVVELNGGQEVQVEVAADDGNTPVSDVKAVIVEMNTSDSVQTQDLGSALEDRSVPPHENSIGEVEEEVNEHACPDDAHLALNDYSSVQTGKQGQFELPGAGVADKADNVVLEAEPRNGVETEVVDVVRLDVPAASTVHNEPRSIDFINNASLDTELETSDHVQAMECSSQEVSSTTVDQVISGVTEEHGTAVADDAELRCKQGDASLEVSSEASVDQGEPVAFGDNKAVVVDEVKPSSATGNESDVVREASDICQTGESHDLAADYQSNSDQPEIFDASATCEELVSPIEGPRLSDETLEPGVKAPCSAQEMGSSDVTCKDVENINACNISSQEVETKCLEVLEPSSIDGVVVPVEHKNDDKNAQKGKEKIAEDSTDSPMDLDKSHKGYIKFIGPPNLFHIVKVPRFAGDDVWARVQEAQVHLDRLTQERDALNVRRKNQKAIVDGYKDKFNAARQEESEARAAFVDKRNGLDSARSVIGKLNQANSIEEIDELIARKERTMEHETISLKQEKLFIKEINELKTQRKQVCSNLGSKAEISEAFHQKDHIHEQHKTLKKEADLLSKNLKSLEENRKKIQISYEDEKAVLGKIIDELNAANVIRQQAYKNWSALRTEPTKKNKYFRMYMTDRDEVSKFTDKDKLEAYCNNQVKNFMEMWNKDDDFRRMYVEANKFSTLKRLETHDGRLLGPGEDRPVIPRNNFNRRPNNPSQLTASSPNMPIATSKEAPEKSAAVVVPVEEDSFPVLPPNQIHKQVKSKTAGSSSQKEITTAPVSEVEDVKHIEKEKARRPAEELELTKKADEELARKDKEIEEQRAAERERIVSEQKAKAKEAAERKKRQAQKAQERIEFRLLKEAEEREKRKEQKIHKIVTVPAGLAGGNGEGSSAATGTPDTESNSSENARDSKVPQQAPPRRNTNRAVKQINKLEPMPDPLKNKFRKKTQHYVFIGVAVALAVVALILAGRSLNLPGLNFLGS